MARRKPFPPRPARAFIVGAVSWQLDIVARHTSAGFAPVSDDMVRAHYFRYWQFLKAQGYLLKELPLVPRGWDGELWSSDLTLQGYRFAQYSHDRWIGRIRKFSDAPSDIAYLAKWHVQFLALPIESFASSDA